MANFTIVPGTNDPFQITHTDTPFELVTTPQTFALNAVTAQGPQGPSGPSGGPGIDGAQGPAGASAYLASKGLIVGRTYVLNPGATSSNSEVILHF